MNGHDVVHAGAGPDIVNGGNAGDLLIGGNGWDLLIGGNGKDVLRGGDGRDVLVGGNGKDVLIGGEGADRMRGGNGNDTFVFRDASNSPADGRYDTITDFGHGDTLSLGRLGTVEGLAEGPEAWHARVEQDGDNAVVYVDTDGCVDGENPAEMGIVLLNVDADSLTAADFLF